ncbi:minor tail protein [Mycobacterium phage PainterBoy]|nr:minor tail protein [Mycobacterium phage PainterBoy]
MSIPTQESHDSEDPRQHVIWALRNMPMLAGVGAITHPGYLADWSEHLWKCGFRHVDWLRRLADKDGYIHVSQLPEQKIKFQQPFRGQRHTMNNAARWVGKDEKDPEPVRIPDIRKLTQQENEAMLRQYREAGMIPDNSPGPSQAETFA